ncbi:MULTISPECIES: SemiSWEET transporter [unclassified Rickettsia]|uniref:SemiSWEET transporter n=1 Tax=unclassified Rickettsia TaxID=114295 RepID=UPI0020A22810|nr:SemiSWEET transporter [Rickettsia endosymbiont of Ceutorhynchus assimilis]
MSDYTEIMGYIAGILTTIAFVPQVIKTYQSRSTQNISLSMYVIYCTSVVLWLIYGILINSFPLIITETITLILSGAILIMKCLWK